MATAELIFKIRTESADFKSTMAQVRSELNQTQRVQQTTAKSELSTRQQLSAATALQRQRSAALIAEWKKTERAASDLARGVGPVKDNLQKITDVMQTLGGASASLQGPLGGVAGRLRSLGSLASEAGGGLGIAGVAAGAAVVGVVALTVAAAVLAREFIGLVVATADWQGKLFDLSQQTGVSVETLNALEIAAGKTGGSIESIESIAQSLVIYQGHLDDAQDASSEMGKKFAELGISIDNTEDSLRSAFTALAKMPEGFHQTNEAAELFGRRGGKQVLAILKETNGDIDSAVTKLGALARVTTAEAAAADEFNDALKDVSTTMRGLTALVVRDSIPQILSGLRAVSQLATKVLSENKEAISAISTAVGVFVRGNLVILLGGLNAIQLALNGVNNTWLAVKSLLAAGITGDISIVMTIFRAFKDQQQGLAALSQGGAQGESWKAGVGGGFSQPAKGAGGGKGSGGGGAKTDPAIALLKNLQDEYGRLTERTKEQEVEQALLTKEFANTDVEMRKAILNVARMIDAKKAKAEVDKEIARLTEIAIEQQKREQESVERFLQSQQSELDELSGKVRTAEDDVNDFRVAYARLGGVMDEATLATIKANAGLVEHAKRWAVLHAAIKAAVQELRGWKKEQDPFEGVEGGAEGIGGQSGSAIDQLFQHINDNLTGTQQTAALAGLQAITEGFGAMAQAVGAAATAWIFYGKAGQSVRQVTAQVLASITQMAIAKAAFELAEGFAMLAASFFGIPMAGPSAAMHFKAAAMYGIVAGAAALAGRAAAGNSFSQTGGGAANGAFQSATGGGGSRSGGSSGGNGSSAPIVQGSQRPGIVIHKFIPPPGYGEQIVIAALDSNHPEIRRLLERENR